MREFDIEETCRKREFVKFAEIFEADVRIQGEPGVIGKAKADSKPGARKTEHG